MFVPRLGAEVTNISISPDQTIYAAGLLDNSIKLISMINFSFKQALQGLKYGIYYILMIIKEILKLSLLNYHFGIIFF